MALIYRNDGAWGAGKGARLTSLEADGNIHDLDARLHNVETNPPAAVSIDHLSVIDLPYAAVQELGRMAERSMNLQCLIQDGQVQIIDAAKTTTIEPIWRKRAT